MSRPTRWIRLYEKPIDLSLLKIWTAENLGQWKIHRTLRLVAAKKGEKISVCDPITAEKHLRQSEVWKQRLVSQIAKNG